MIMSDIDGDDLKKRFFQFILHPSFPCVGAKSALARYHLDLIVADDLGSDADDSRILCTLGAMARAYHNNPEPFQSLAVIFRGPNDLCELGFEQALWARIQALSDRDAAHGSTYDARVSANTDDPHFSLSFAGEAFFLIGMHPHSSRPARRFITPVLVFNPHDQFERLREANRYDGLRGKIMARDIALAGSPNPMLAEHGESSEARQYSGRKVTDGWRCPFEAHNKEVRNDQG